MRAVRVHEWNAEPKIQEVPDPVATQGHSVVAVRAATVAHLDRTIWTGMFHSPPSRPYTPGVEAAGVILESEAYPPDARVWIRGGGLGVNLDGTWAERVLAPDMSMGPLPDGVDMPVGAAFFSPCTSAWVSLVDVGSCEQDDTVLVTGANGAVGSMAVQLAQGKASHVIGAVSAADRADGLPKGVEVCDLSSGEVPACDLLIDAAGGPVLEQVLPHVRSGGRAVLVGYVAGKTVELVLPDLIQRDVALLPLNMINREAQGRAAAPALLQMLGDGTLKLPTTTFSFDAVSEALDWLTRRGTQGRAVIVP